ncbi:DUF5906 domain-containing protein [Lichenihabitans psoromatis]|uniref:DUF5906 domain-containing protein n=1 Tax=Lichenihabitans psoromatis TaxID=2528642 RepID=UPI0010383870|nr:DUF5906 domain-containing protein [Lichenihabitans psoromatis]
MSEPSRSDDVVRRIEGAEILAFPRAITPAEAGSAPATDHARAARASESAKISDTVSGDTGRDGGPPGGGPSDGSSDDGGDGIDRIVETLNRAFALVVVGQRALIIWEIPEAQIEDRVRMISIEAFKALHHNRFSLVTKRERQEDGSWSAVRKPMKWAPVWMSAPERRTFKGIEFNPNPDGNLGTPGYFNLWRGFSVVPDPGPAEGRMLKYKTFYDHLLTNVCSGNRPIFDWMFHWFAHIVQHPRERIGTAIVLRGKQGTGKTKVGEYIGALFASHYFLVDDPRYLVGQFNAHMASCLLLQVDEGFWAGDKAAEGRLKGLVTAPKQMIEAKGVDPIRLDNYVRLLFSSNEDWVVPAGMEERRFAVLDVAPNVLQNHAYFAEMDAEMKAGGLEALLADLLAVDLDAPDAPKLRIIPKTNALLEQKLRSLDPISSWWFERLMEGAPTHRRSQWPKEAPITVLFDDYVRTAERVGIRRKADMTSFGMRMKRLVPDLRKTRIMCDVEMPDGSVRYSQVWCYVMPSLVECREAFEAALGGQAVEWSVSGPETEPTFADEAPAGGDF